LEEEKKAILTQAESFHTTALPFLLIPTMRLISFIDLCRKSRIDGEIKTEMILNDVSLFSSCHLMYVVFGVDRCDNLENNFDDTINIRELLMYLKIKSFEEGKMFSAFGERKLLSNNHLFSIKAGFFSRFLSFNDKDRGILMGVKKRMVMKEILEKNNRKSSF
jgi:hypothetical protein